MTESDFDMQEMLPAGSPRKRALPLAASTLEISASLYLDTVLRKVAEKARRLTAAVPGDLGFELSLDNICRAPTSDSGTGCGSGLALEHAVNLPPAVRG